MKTARCPSFPERAIREIMALDPLAVATWLDLPRGPRDRTFRRWVCVWCQGPNTMRVHRDFFCRACGRSGGPIAAVMAARGLTFDHAVRELACHFCIPLADAA